MTEFKGKRSVKDIMSGVKGNVTWTRKRANNTVEYALDDGSRHIRLHDTDIISFMPNGDTVLNSGGYQTRTTKDRINKFLPFGRVYQDKRIWYFMFIPWDEAEQPHVFQDGMIITKDREVLHAGKQDKLDKHKKQITKYVNAYCEKLFNHELPKPSGGDCWICCMVDVKSDKSWGEMSHDKEHILRHFKDKYYVPSLVVNACRAIGVSKAAWQYLGECFNPPPYAVVWFQTIAERQIKSALRRFLYSQLGMAK